jgi:hypothetical protein
MCFLVEFHSDDARVLCRQVLASLAFGWRGREYYTTTCEEPNIGYRRYHHSDRGLSDSLAESTTWHLPEICQSHQSSTPTPGQVGRQSEGHCRDVNVLRIHWKTCSIKLYIFIWIKWTKINWIQNYKLK